MSLGAANLSVLSWGRVIVKKVYHTLFLFHFLIVTSNGSYLHPKVKHKKIQFSLPLTIANVRWLFFCFAVSEYLLFGYSSLSELLSVGRLVLSGIFKCYNAFLSMFVSMPGVLNLGFIMGFRGSARIRKNHYFLHRMECVLFRLFTLKFDNSLRISYINETTKFQ